MRLGRDANHIFAQEYLKDLDVGAAAERMGIMRSPGYFGRALFNRPAVQREIQLAVESRRLRVQCDADLVLSDLMRQLARLTAMLGQDIAELYTEAGNVKQIQEWPDVWRRRLVTQIESQDTFERSHDGTVADEAGRKSWDKSGTVTKIKRESTLAIEREIRETLKTIGQHTQVNAFPRPNVTLETHVHLHAEIVAKLQGALQREQKMLTEAAAEVIEATVVTH